MGCLSGHRVFWCSTSIYQSPYVPSIYWTVYITTKIASCIPSHSHHSHHHKSLIPDLNSHYDGLLTCIITSDTSAAQPQILSLEILFRHYDGLRHAFSLFILAASRHRTYPSLCVFILPLQWPKYTSFSTIQTDIVTTYFRSHDFKRALWCLSLHF